MKKIIKLSPHSYLFYFPCVGTENAVLIVPNSASYFAVSPRYGEAGPCIDRFCLDLSEQYDVYYLVLPGQGLKNGKYSYTGSVEATVEALEFLKESITGIIGMCTGGAIAVEAMQKIGLNKLPLILYNTAASVGWSNPPIQKIFLRKYGNVVDLDCEELERNAPSELAPIIAQHGGEMLQIASGNSDYKIELQQSLKIPNMETKTFMTMSDAPIAESTEYQAMLGLILKFFERENKGVG